MVDRLDILGQIGFCDRLMDRQTDGQIFAILESLLRLKSKVKTDNDCLFSFMYESVVPHKS